MKFSVKQKVLFKHCDPAGIVFYPRYFEMINDCVEAFFCEIGSPFETLHETAGVPTAQISATFQAPSRHGDHLDINMWITRIGGSSLGVSIQASNQAEKRFTADATLVYVNALGRPQRWPDKIRNALTPYFRSEE
jgi:4-hydroxybenzoyl-CoA thioesterase